MCNFSKKKTGYFCWKGFTYIVNSYIYLEINLNFHLNQNHFWVQSAVFVKTLLSTDFFTNSSLRHHAKKCTYEKVKNFKINEYLLLKKAVLLNIKEISHKQQVFLNALHSSNDISLLKPLQKKSHDKQIFLTSPSPTHLCFFSWNAIQIFLKGKYNILSSTKLKSKCIVRFYLFSSQIAIIVLIILWKKIITFLLHNPYE